jgi:hypothetical protein
MQAWLQLTSEGWEPIETRGANGGYKIYFQRLRSAR